MTVPAVRSLADDVWALLQAVTNVNHYRGVVDTSPPKDPDGKVHAHTVFYPGAGRQVATRSCATPAALAWSFQITCVGGDDNRCLWCVDKVRTGLADATVADGYLIRPVRDADPGPVRRDDDTEPPRFYLPLLFGVYIP